MCDFLIVCMFLILFSVCFVQDMIGVEQEVSIPKDGMGSKFSQWFQPGSRGSPDPENSRRSSINEEFSYLNGKRHLPSDLKGGVGFILLNAKIGYCWLYLFLCVRNCFLIMHLIYYFSNNCID